MTASVQDSSAEIMSTATRKTPPRIMWWAHDPRCELAYVVFNLSNRLERLAGRIHRDLQGSTHEEEARVWYGVGQRDGARQAMRIARLSYDAGKATGRENAR